VFACQLLEKGAPSVFWTRVSASYHHKPLKRTCSTFVRLKQWIPTLPVHGTVPFLWVRTLNEKVKKWCTLAGTEGNKTNHSLRATGTTQTYDGGVPEKVIQERTGRSIEALRCCEGQACSSTVLFQPFFQHQHNLHTWSNCTIKAPRLSRCSKLKPVYLIPVYLLEIYMVAPLTSTLHFHMPPLLSHLLISV